MVFKINKSFKKNKELLKHKKHRVTFSRGGAKYPFEKLTKVGYSFYAPGVKVGTLESCAINWVYRRELLIKFKVVLEKGGARIYRTV